MTITLLFKRLLLSLLLLTLSVNAWTACSTYMGLASINEISKTHNWRDNPSDFIEVKKLDSQLDAAVMNNWSLEICETVLGLFVSCSNPMSLSTASVVDKYLSVIGSPEPSSFIDWVGGFDIVLKDQFGDIVDYVSVNGVTEQYEACPYPFPTTATGANSTRRTRRQPDGVGDWDVPPGNSQPPSEGETNEGDPPPPGSPELSFKQDVTVGQGQTAILTLVLTGTQTSDVIVNYATTNGTATAGTDYTSVSSSITIPGSSNTYTEVPINVDTLIGGAVVTQYFFMTIESALVADVIDQVAQIDISLFSGADHFNISHSGNGINCQAELITITAIDNAGNPLTSFDGKINLSVLPAHGDWSHPSSSVNFSAIGSDQGTAQYNFDGSEGGVVQLWFSNTHVEPSDINVIDNLGIAETSNAAVLADDLPIVFSQSGFNFIYGDGSPPATEVFPTFTSSRPLIQGLSYQPLKLRAITTDINTGVCTSLFNGAQTVELAIECMSPLSCDSSLNSEFQVDGIAVAENTSSTILNYSNITLNFSGHSTADLANSVYHDAGQVRFHARKIQSGDDIIGSSLPAVFMPHGFCMNTPEANSDCLGSNDTEYIACSRFKAAGEIFNLDVTAQGWQVDGDNNFCDNNRRLLSFSSDVNITPLATAPSGGNNGNLSLTSIALNAGLSNSVISWDEMGVLNITAGGNNYLSNALPFNSSDDIGRFIPDHFSMSIITEHGSFADGNTGFTYVGELDALGNGAINYNIEPEGEFIARNAYATPVVLQNYIGLFKRNPQFNLTSNTSILGLDNSTVLNLTSVFSSGLPSYDASNQTHKITLNPADHFLFNRDANSFRMPFTHDISLMVNNLVDDDGVSLINPGLNFTPTGGEIRYGRLVVENAYGPETGPILQTIRAQYYDGNDFIFNASDGATSMDIVNINSQLITDVGNISAPLLVSDTAVSGELADTGPMVMGNWRVNWSAPLNGHYGTLQYTYGAPTWLQYDWTGSGMSNPVGSVSFGQYRGHDKFIYWKEINY